VHAHLRPDAFLIIGGTKVFPIEKQVVKIGRAYENDLMLEYPQVSRLHAELRFDQGSYEIIDLNSTGGTFVNGERIKQQTLSKGDVITLVNLHLVFGQDDPPDYSSVIPYAKPGDSIQAAQNTQTLPQSKTKKPTSSEGSSF
jgi:pSer/pThr/pTyr-binding forkhead associated (FHA) protein